MNPSDKLAKLRALGETPPSVPETPQHSGAAPKKAGIVAVLVAALAKFKVGLVLLLSKLKLVFVLFKAAKFSKFIFTFASMAAMMWFYSVRFGAPFAIGFVLLIFIHELGHVWAAYRLGYPVSAPIFIPFFGAFITLKEHPRSAEQEFFLAAAGPIAGGMGAVLTLGLAQYFPSSAPLLYALAGSAFMINFFNLIPWYPLDGGRMTMAFSTFALFVLGAGAIVAFLDLSGVQSSSVATLLIVGILLLFKAGSRIVRGTRKSSSKIAQLQQLAMEKRQTFESPRYAVFATVVYGVLATGLLLGGITLFR